MASRTEWQPLPDGRYDAQHFNHEIEVDRDYLKLSCPGFDGGVHDEVEVGLPDDIRLCHLVEVPAAPAVPPDIAETIREALIKRRDNLEDMIDTFRSYVDDADLQRFRDAIERNSVALQWLAAQKGGE